MGALITGLILAVPCVGLLIYEKVRQHRERRQKERYTAFYYQRKDEEV